MVKLSTVVDRQQLATRYTQVRARTEALAAPLSPEDQTVQSMPDVSPTKWHRAHTSWFFETFLLGPSLDRYEPFNPAFGFLFNSYYEGVGARHERSARGLLSRPGIDEIAAYRHHVDLAMARLLGQPSDDRVLALTELGIHHEQQHQELLLMDIKHVLSRNPLAPPYTTWDAGAPAEASKCTWTSHDGGLVDIGYRGDGFAFDNESPRHTIYLQPFSLARRPVTCGEWLAFVDDGGYHHPELWLSDGWATIVGQQWEAPLYWSRVDGEWHVFTLGGSRPLNPAEPVCHVSYYEADAFARWAGARLPTEAEWEAVAASEPAGPTGRADGHRALHPVPTSGTEPDFFGAVWQWTATAYQPYPGFTPAPGAVGEYNGKFMVNQYVLRGSCCATPDGHARTTYRNFYPASARWPFSGLRLAKDA